jgi:peptide methionine sulfoxide reductase msrA/msrB
MKSVVGRRLGWLLLGVSLALVARMLPVALVRALAQPVDSNGWLYAKEANPMNFRTLTAEEERVIVRKGTERPFSGRFNDFSEEGIYTCRRCGAMLYRSDDKFDSGCGWPAFDDELPGAVKRVPDADGRRTEILCAHCGGHLGHVFTGEELTRKNVRHCVNSVSMDFVPLEDAAFGEAIVAGGCFWGVEYWLKRLPGVFEAVSGYTGGQTEAPSYQDICAGGTGHAEAVRVVYDPVRLEYETVLRAFFEVHDPTQLNRQGPDVGDQYRSAVFYKDEQQRAVAQRLIDELRAAGYAVQTELSPAARFWPAEAYHQQYYDLRGREPACHRPVKRFGGASADEPGKRGGP